MSNFSNVNDAWAAYTQAYAYLRAYAPHLVSSFGTPPPEPNIDSRSLLELVGLVDKLKWVILQEEERAVDSHVRGELGEALLDDRVKSLEERLDAVEDGKSADVAARDILVSRVRVVSEEFQRINSRLSNIEAMFKPLLNATTPLRGEKLAQFVDQVIRARTDNSPPGQNNPIEHLSMADLTKDIHAQVGKELQELVSAADELNTNLRKRLREALDKASDIVSPKKSSSTKPTE